MAISETSKKLLNEIKNSPFGNALQEYLDEEYNIINDVTKCKDWEDTVGRRYALEALERLFSFMSRPKVEIRKSGGKYE